MLNNRQLIWYSQDELSATPPLRPHQLATSYLQAASTHHSQILHFNNTIKTQHQAISIASSTLDMNTLAITDAFSQLAEGARMELDKQESLLAGLDADLEIIDKINIHPEFMNPTVRRAIEAGDKSRTLGYYVSKVKMKQVAETCRKTHREYSI